MTMFYYECLMLAIRNPFFSLGCIIAVYDKSNDVNKLYCFVYTGLFVQYIKSLLSIKHLYLQRKCSYLHEYKLNITRS